MWWPGTSHKWLLEHSVCECCEKWAATMRTNLFWHWLKIEKNSFLDARNPNVVQYAPCPILVQQNTCPAMQSMQVLVTNCHRACWNKLWYYFFEQDVVMWLFRAGWPRNHHLDMLCSETLTTLAEQREENQHSNTYYRAKEDRSLPHYSLNLRWYKLTLHSPWATSRRETCENVIWCRQGGGMADPWLPRGEILKFKTFLFEKPFLQLVL